MTDNTDSLMQSISLNQILVAILEEQGKVSVPTLKFLDAQKENKELVVDYDEDGPSFVFSLRSKNE
jgi:uncharacterized membrane protein YcaP (DUF421 family)